MNPQNDEIEIDLRELLHVIIKRIWIILASVVAGGVVVWLISYYLITPKYQSTSQIYILTSSQQLVSLSDLQMGSSLANDYQYMIRSRTVVEEVIENLDLKMGYGTVLGMLSIENPPNSRILNITIEYTDPQVAKEIADNFAEVASETISTIMQVDKPSIFAKAVAATSQSSPNNSRNAVLGAIVGMVLSIAVVIILHIMDDTVKNSEDVERFLGINTLAAIPEEGGTDNKEKSSGSKRRRLLWGRRR